jgi:non-ribosomal peptide synthetase component F
VVSGPQITRGYLNLPDKTAAVFVANPYATPDTHTEVMYRTGDLARWLPCGQIECLGRTDHQVGVLSGVWRGGGQS